MSDHRPPWQSGAVANLQEICSSEQTVARPPDKPIKVVLHPPADGHDVLLSRFLALRLVLVSLQGITEVAESHHEGAELLASLASVIFDPHFQRTRHFGETLHLDCI